MAGILIAGLALAPVTACSKRHLRGTTEPSRDGHTYLVVDDDNGSACGPLRVDGQPWTHPLHTRGLVTPGIHSIACGTEIEFEIPDTTIFHFDYWGP
jgi:hypothetical protein